MEWGEMENQDLAKVVSAEIVLTDSGKYNIEKSRRIGNPWRKIRYTYFR